MKKSDFREELAAVDDVMQRDLSKSDRKKLIKRLNALIREVDESSGQGDLSKKAALRIRIDLLYLIKIAKKNNLEKKDSREKVRALFEDMYEMYKKQPKSARGASAEDKIMGMLFRSFR